MRAMNRRHWLGAAAVAPFAWAQTRPTRLKIDKVEFLRLEGSRIAESGVNKQHQVNPSHVYDARIS